jgi:transposase
MEKPTRKVSSGATDWREGRRLRAWELHEQGWTQQRIAEALGVTQGAVSHWLQRVEEAGGVEGLYRRPPKGAKPKLTPEQLAELPDLLKQGAPAFGFAADVWTCKRVGAVIERVYGVKYHLSQVARILHQIGWSVQKPVRVAAQQDQEAVREWKEERWPVLKKSG